MIISAASRTDIPAYFSNWFYNRIKEGYVLSRNPYNPHQVTRFKLSPDVVDCISFCTKNPGPMLNRLDEISDFNQFWSVTITPYGKDIEPNVPDKLKVIESFKELSRRVGIKSISWRYDPIFITEKYSVDYHLRAFEKMAGALNNYTDNCVISFIDLYAKTIRNFPNVRAVEKEDRITLGKAFIEIGRRNGITIRTCLEGRELEEYGADVSGCFTQKILERSIGAKLDMPKKKPAREGCNCILNNDIGVYNTCGHGCLYCYANYDNKIVKHNMMLHDPNSPLLIGHLTEDDKVKDADQKSYINNQISFF